MEFFLCIYRHLSMASNNGTIYAILAMEWMTLWSIAIGAPIKNRTLKNPLFISQTNLFTKQFTLFFYFYSGSSHGGPSNSNTQKHHKQRLVNINNNSTNSTCPNDPGSQASNDETIGNSTSSVPGSALPTIQSAPSNVITNSCFIAGNSSNNLNSNSNLNNNGNNSTAVNLNLKVCVLSKQSTAPHNRFDSIRHICFFFGMKCE